MVVKSERIHYYDNLKFILIALVVIGHFIDPFVEIFPAYLRIYFFIYLFHMPLFMFITGMFSRKTLGIGIGTDGDGLTSLEVATRFISAPRETQAPAVANEMAGSHSFLYAALNRVVSFTILYLILNFGIFAIQHYMRGIGETYDPLRVTNASWYLLGCAFLTLIALLPFVRGANKNMKSRLLIIFFCTAIAVIVGRFDFINDFLTLSRVICFLPFFLAGLYTDPSALADLLGGKRPIGRFHIGNAARAGAAAIIICAILIVIFMPDEWLRLRGIFTARNPYSYLGGLAGSGYLFRFLWYASALFLGFSVMLLVPLSRTFFTRLGRNTLSIFIWHSLTLRLLGAASLVPAVAALTADADAFVRALAMCIPVALALAFTFIFARKPPFGILAAWIMKFSLVSPRKKR